MFEDLPLFISTRTVIIFAVRIIAFATQMELIAEFRSPQRDPRLFGTWPGWEKLVDALPKSIDRYRKT